MNEQAWEQVKQLVEDWDDDWGCGPYEDCLPEEEELQTLNELTGRAWEAEDVREACFEYHSHNSLEETVYFLFHGEYPPVTNTMLVFYRPKPGAVLKPQEVYEKYRLGGQMKALEKLPMEAVVDAFRSLPGWQEYKFRQPSGHSFRFNCLDQPNPWADVHFWLRWYGRETEVEREHQLLCLSCHNLTEEQRQSLLDCLTPFDIPLQYQEEDHAY